MAKQPAKKPDQEKTTQEYYVHKGTKKARSKKPGDYKDAALSGRMADYVIQQIPKQYDPWENNDLSEDDVVEDIVIHCGRYIRYSESGWMGWNAEDGCWKGEEYAESMVQWIVRHFGRLLAESATEERYEELRFARGIRNSSGINAVMTILKRDKRIAVLRDSFDTDPAVRNCLGDLYNLKTGEVRPCEPEDYITKSDRYKPAEVEDEDKMPDITPEFKKFIMQVTSKDGIERPDLALWVLFYFGYCLTGETGASFFVNFHGGGQNGKSVLLKLMMSIMGDYAAPISQDIIIENRFASQFLLSGMHGIRMGVLADAGEGQLNMKLIKEITTGDPMNVPMKFKKDSTLRSVCKLAVGSNQRLSLKNTGMDAKRRVRMVPFDYTVPDEEIVPDLEKKLLAEAPQILRLLIYFARQYYKVGGGARAFPACEVIDEASKEYLESQDLVGRWVKEKTEPMQGNEEDLSDMYKNFQAWCANEGIKKVMGKNKFGEHLSVHIKEKKHKNTGTAYLNIKLTGPPLPGS